MLAKQLQLESIRLFEVLLQINLMGKSAIDNLRSRQLGELLFCKYLSFYEEILWLGERVSTNGGNGTVSMDTPARQEPSNETGILRNKIIVTINESLWIILDILHERKT